MRVIMIETRLRWFVGSSGDVRKADRLIKGHSVGKGQNDRGEGRHALSQSTRSAQLALCKMEPGLEREN